MKAHSILLAGITGTSLMTLFSYVVSRLKKQDFKEPQLLAQLEKDLLPNSVANLALPAGWSTHYAVGISLALLYELMFQKTSIRPNTTTALASGTLLGLISVVAWKSAFRMDSNPPHIAYGQFYKHLLPAHLIFSAVVVAMINRRK